MVHHSEKANPGLWPLCLLIIARSPYDRFEGALVRAACLPVIWMADVEGPAQPHWNNQRICSFKISII